MTEESRQKHPQPPVLEKSNGTFFALSVADVAASSRWYQEKLGFRVAKDGELPDGSLKFALLELNGNVIEMVQHNTAQPLAQAVPSIKDAYQIHGFFKIGFHVQDLDAVYERIKERGVPIAYDIYEAKDVALRSFMIRDNQGNPIQFFGK